jgi:hypothetical protein
MNKYIVAKTEPVVLTEEEKLKRASHFYLLFSSLNCVDFAIVQLDPNGMKQDQKMMFNNLKNTSKNFLNYLYKKANPEDKELLQSMSFENISAMACIFGMMNQIPVTQVEWFIEQCESLVWAAANRELLKENKND